MILTFSALLFPKSHVPGVPEAGYTIGINYSRRRAFVTNVLRHTMTNQIMLLGTKHALNNAVLIKAISCTHYTHNYYQMHTRARVRSPYTTTRGTGRVGGDPTNTTSLTHPTSPTQTIIPTVLDTHTYYICIHLFLALYIK